MLSWQTQAQRYSELVRVQMCVITKLLAGARSLKTLLKASTIRVDRHRDIPTMSAVKCTKAIKAGFSAEELEMMQNVGVAASTTASQKSFATGGNLVSRENQCLFFKTSSPNGRRCDIPRSNLT